MKRAGTIISSIAILIAILWFIFEPGFEPVITALFGIAGLVGSLTMKKEMDGQKYSDDDINVLREFLRNYSDFFAYLFSETEELAFAIHDDALENLGYFRDYWYTDKRRSFNPEIRKIQDSIQELLVQLRQIYEINMYDSVGHYIRFDTNNFDREILLEKKRKPKI